MTAKGRPARLLERLRRETYRTSALDLRSLALFRIALGCVTLLDLWHRLVATPAFYSSAGILPPDAVGSLPPLPLQLFLHPATEPFTEGFIWIGIGAAVLLTAGHRPRLAAAVCAFLLVSLNHRNPQVLHLADRLQVHFLIWASLLPVGARLSVEALRAAQRGESGIGLPNPFHSVASVGLHLQVAVVYYTTGMLKARQPTWTDGSHLGLTLDRIEYLKAPGMFLRELGFLHAPLTWSVLALQVGGGILLLLPWRYLRLRLGVLAVLVLMQAGMGSSLHVGLFPWVSIAGLLALIPPGTWAGGGERVAPAFRGESSAAVPATRVGHAAAIGLLAVLVVESLNDHLQFLSEEGLVGRVPAGQNLMQRWTMFTGSVDEAGWFVVAGVTARGDTINLLRGGVSVTPDPPSDPWNDFPDYRWRILLANTLRHGTQSPWQAGYLRYMAREWNAVAPEVERIQSAALIQFRYRPGPSGGPLLARPMVLAEIQVEGGR